MVAPGSSAVRVRDKYTSRACQECQRRKRKCSGEKVCRNCRHWGTECISTESRGRRDSRERGLRALQNVAAIDWANADNRANAGASIGISLPPTRDRTPIDGVANAVQPLAGNGGNGQLELERVTSTTTTQIQGATQQALAQILSPNTAAQYLGDNIPGQSPFSTIDTDLSSPRDSVFERDTNFMTGTAFFQQIDLLDRSVMRAQGTDSTKAGESLGSLTTDLNTSVADIYREIDVVVEQSRMEDAAKTHRSLDIFFANVQPHYPCMNEGHLRARFSAFVAKDSNCLTKNGTVQLAALLNFIVAVVRILCDPSAQGEHLPGWKEFCRGEKLLGHTTWLERANIVTIQTLLVKTLYFTYAGLLNSAYDTMGTTVRLCFQLGLHNEPSWGDDCKFYDRTYRQRVFWSVFCLNHNVAQTRGVPELLRESDLNVGLPSCVDDRMLYPDCPPLPEMPATSPVPYLLEIIKLTRLSSEVWEAMFGARAKRPVSQDFIMAMDTKMVELLQEIPQSLRWPPIPGSHQIYEGAPPFIQQQGFVLHLRILYLRMLLRREEMISLAYSKKVAQLCIDVATEVVGAVETFHSAQRSNRCERHAYLHHLTGALVPMICIIVRQNNGEELTRPAINLLNQSLNIIESFSPGSFLARRILQQLRRPIKIARDIIEQGARAGVAPNAMALSTAASTQNTVRGVGNINPRNEWDLSLPNVYQDPFQDPLQKPPDMAFLWDDTGIDLWNNFNWSA